MVFLNAVTLWALWVLANSTSWAQSFPQYKSKSSRDHNLTCESLLQLRPACSTSLWCWSEQSIPLPHATARKGHSSQRPPEAFSQIVPPYVVDTQTPGVTELRRRRETNTFYFSRLPLMSWEDGRRCRWGRDSVPAHGEWCCLPHLSSV